MTVFAKGDRVRAPDPDTGDEIVGEFLVAADQQDGLEVPLAGDTRIADAALIRLDDDTIVRVVYAKLRSA